MNFNEYYAKYKADKEKNRKKLLAAYGLDSGDKTANFSKTENADQRKANFQRQTEELRVKAEKIFNAGEIRYSDSVRARQAKDPLFNVHLMPIEMYYKTFNLEKLNLSDVQKTTIIASVIEHRTVYTTIPVKCSSGSGNVVFKTVPDEHGKYHYTLIDFEK